MTKAEVVWLRAAPLLLFAVVAIALFVDALIRSGLSDFDFTMVIVAGFIVIATRNAIGHLRNPVLDASRTEAIAYAAIYIAGAVGAIVWMILR